jgi:hypothetical protein
MNATVELSQTLLIWEDHQGLKRPNSEQGFVCKHCRSYVTTHTLFSGVQNRNHCPFCLWSRHLDLAKSGDRLAACKAVMQPVGLALKQLHKKYTPPSLPGPRNPHSLGELMLIHRCTECGKTSLNRIAADDDAATVLEVYEQSLTARWRLDGIRLLTARERKIVQARLFGLG